MLVAEVFSQLHSPTYFTCYNLLPRQHMTMLLISFLYSVIFSRQQVKHDSLGVVTYRVSRCQAMIKTTVQND